MRQDSAIVTMEGE